MGAVSHPQYHPDLDLHLHHALGDPAASRYDDDDDRRGTILTSDTSPGSHFLSFSPPAFKKTTTTVRQNNHHHHTIVTTNPSHPLRQGTDMDDGSFSIYANSSADGAVGDDFMMEGTAGEEHHGVTGNGAANLAHPSDTSDAGSKKPRMTRIHQACINCGLKKQKCTGDNPCSPCVQAGIDCGYRESKKR